MKKYNVLIPVLVACLLLASCTKDNLSNTNAKKSTNKVQGVSAEPTPQTPHPSCPNAQSPATAGGNG